MRLLAFLALVLAAVLTIPVLGIAGSWLVLDAQALDTLAHQFSTVLPAYAAQSGGLALAVAAGVTLVGTGAAACVTLFEFPGRRHWEWALLLPLAVPAYVLAYAYTDALQFSGPLQTSLREWLGASGALWPDVRSAPAAAVLFTLALYPYVYLLTRTALADRGVQLMEAARLLGAGFWRRVGEVALPLARPAIVAGVALALMETLADYGVGSYFGLTTFSTGIYKAWLSMNDRAAAAQLATVLLAVVAVLLWLEHRAQARLRFALSRSGAATSQDARPLVLRGSLAMLAIGLCAAPVLLGFVVPLLLLGRLLWLELQYGDIGLPLEAFARWAGNSFFLAGLAAVMAAVLALVLASVARSPRSAGGWGRAARWASRVVGLGYAIPGGVIAIGILLPVGTLQAWAPGWGVPAWFTGTILGITLAYLVRFAAVAQQSIEAGFARLPPSLDETARMLGASPGRVFLGVHVPLLQRSVIAAVLLVFVDVMKELPATLVLRPFDTDTLAVVAFNLARDERLGEAALPSLAIVAVGLIPVVMLSRALRRAER